MAQDYQLKICPADWRHTDNEVCGNHTGILPEIVEGQADTVHRVKGHPCIDKPSSPQTWNAVVPRPPYRCGPSDFKFPEAFPPATCLIIYHEPPWQPSSWEAGFWPLIKRNVALVSQMEGLAANIETGRLQRWWITFQGCMVLQERPSSLPDVVKWNLPHVVFIQILNLGWKYQTCSSMGTDFDNFVLNLAYLNCISTSARWK